MSFTDPRRAYLQSTVETASPERLLVMLVDRLVRDVRQAAEAQERSDRETAHECLMHAQEIVLELRAGLHVEKWDGGPGLASLYEWLFARLVRANVTQDPEVTRSSLGLVEDLATTWREAALAVAERP